MASERAMVGGLLRLDIDVTRLHRGRNWRATRRLRTEILHRFRFYESKLHKLVEGFLDFYD